MSVHRLSISVPPETEQAIRAAADAAGMPVSSWLAQVAREQAVEQAAIADGLAAVREYEAENGRIEPSAAERSWANEVLVDAGLISGPSLPSAR